MFPVDLQLGFVSECQIGYPQIQLANKPKKRSVFQLQFFNYLTWILNKRT